MRPFHVFHWLLLAGLALGCAKSEEDASRRSGSVTVEPAVIASHSHAVPAAVLPTPGAEPVTSSPVQAEGQLGPGRGTLVVDIKPPPGGKLTVGAPLRLSGRGDHVRFPEHIKTKLDPRELPLRLPIEVTDGATGPVELDLVYYWCTEGDDGSCRPERARLSVQLDLSGAHAGGEAFLRHRPAS